MTEETGRGETYVLKDAFLRLLEGVVSHASVAREQHKYGSRAMQVSLTSRTSVLDKGYLYLISG